MEDEMIALVVYACLATEPATCSQEVVQWADQASALSCSAPMSAPLAAWAEAHPDRIIKNQWCMADLGPARDASATQARVLPLTACDVHNRATAIMWSHRNPGKTAVEECKRLISQ
jgi:hypothetical protein